MIGERNTFPSRDITEDEAKEIRQLWGRPHISPKALALFMECGGKPLLTADISLVSYMSAAMVSTLKTLEANSEASSKAFARGALIYAGVFQYINRAHQIPVAKEALNRIFELDTVDFILQSREEILDREPNFSGLLDEAWPALTTDKKLQEIAVIGAGAIHLAAIETEKVVLSPAVLNSSHPELECIATDFNQLAAFD
ncbi:MAG TPA: hypothetical protein VFI84_00985 [Candidatus Saccharimonadales bacterium]|nr:hypothetical protein [Candidatus Saccharimonadales bacterium]